MGSVLATDHRGNAKAHEDSGSHICLHHLQEQRTCYREASMELRFRKIRICPNLGALVFHANLLKVVGSLVGALLSALVARSSVSVHSYSNGAAAAHKHSIRLWK